MIQVTSTPLTSGTEATSGITRGINDLIGVLGDIQTRKLAIQERQDRLAQQAIDNKRDDAMLKIQTDKVAKDALSDSRLGELYAADQRSKVAIGNTNNAYEALAGRAGSMTDTEYNAELAKLNDKTVLDTGAFVGGRGLLTPEFVKGVDPKALIEYTSGLDTIDREANADKTKYLREELTFDKNVKAKKDLAEFENKLALDRDARKASQDKSLAKYKASIDTGTKEDKSTDAQKMYARIAPKVAQEKFDKLSKDEKARYGNANNYLLQNYNEIAPAVYEKIVKINKGDTASGVDFSPFVSSKIENSNDVNDWITNRLEQISKVKDKSTLYYNKFDLLDALKTAPQKSNWNLLGDNTIDIDLAAADRTLNAVIERNKNSK